MARAQFLKGRVKKAPDPRALSLEVGAAFAEAAAATAREEAKERSKLGLPAPGEDEELGNAADQLEVEGRDFLKAAVVGSDAPTVLRRAASISVVRECVRRRERMRPEKRQASLLVARKLHSRELAAERRRQRHRKASAHLALVRDAIRSRGKAGKCSSRALQPDAKAAADHAKRYLEYFVLSDDDRTDSDDEDDYLDLCKYFCGEGGAVRREEQERILVEKQTMSQDLIDTCVKEGALFDRGHASRHGTIAATRLSVTAGRHVAPTLQSLAQGRAGKG